MLLQLLNENELQTDPGGQLLSSHRHLERNKNIPLSLVTLLDRKFQLRIVVTDSLRFCSVCSSVHYHFNKNNSGWIHRPFFLKKATVPKSIKE